jgi:DNA-nicking Smr family endonuclease
MARGRDLSPGEAHLWQRVAKTTKPYKALPKIATPVALPPATMADVALGPIVPQQTHPELPHVALRAAKAARAAHVARTLAATTLPKPKPKPAIADASGHKKVRRGKLAIDARIDLHGMRQLEAQTALMGIIARTRGAGGRCVLVVTGKGRPIDPGEDYITPQAGVIKRRLPEWLHGAGLREHIAGYASASAKDGGTGAYYVLLKSNIANK